MESIQAIEQVFGISPEMMVRSVLGLSSGRSGNLGPFALFAMILTAGILGRYVFIIVMTHLRPSNPFEAMGRGQLMVFALLIIPASTVFLSGTGPMQARMEARILEPLGLSRTAIPAIEDTPYATGCLAGTGSAAPSLDVEGPTCVVTNAEAAAGPDGGPSRLRPRPRPEPHT